MEKAVNFLELRAAIISLLNKADNLSAEEVYGVIASVEVEVRLSMFAAMKQAQQELPQKERPDFMAGYDAGMADAKRMAQQGEQPTQRQLDTAMRQWETWKAYALELQAKVVKYEGGSPMILNAAAPAPQPAHQGERAELIRRLLAIANTEANEVADALNEAADMLQSAQPVAQPNIQNQIVKDISRHEPCHTCAHYQQGKLPGVRIHDETCYECRSYWGNKWEAA